MTRSGQTPRSSHRSKRREASTVEYGADETRELEVWALEELKGYAGGIRFAIKNVITGGYLSDNAVGGGAVHFLSQRECEIVVDALNTAETR